MMSKFVSKNSCSLFVLCFIVPLLLDRVSKAWVLSGTWYDFTVSSWLSYTLVYNRGISWGMFSFDHPVYFAILSGVIMFVTLSFTWYAYEQRHNHLGLASCLLVLSGAFSNLFDRFWYQGVVDFIHFHWGEYSFPVFNVADIFICIGIVLLLFVYVLGYEKVKVL